MSSHAIQTSSVCPDLSTLQSCRLTHNDTVCESVLLLIHVCSCLHHVSQSLIVTAFDSHAYPFAANAASCALIFASLTHSPAYKYKNCRVEQVWPKDDSRAECIQMVQLAAAVPGLHSAG